MQNKPKNWMKQLLHNRDNSTKEELGDWGDKLIQEILMSGEFCNRSQYSRGPVFRLYSSFRCLEVKSVFSITKLPCEITAKPEEVHHHGMKIWRSHQLLIKFNLRVHEDKVCFSVEQLRSILNAATGKEQSPEQQAAYAAASNAREQMRVRYLRSLC